MAHAEDLTVEELEQIIEDRRSNLGPLMEQREKLAAELDELDAKIASLKGGKTSKGSKVAKKRKPTRRGRRAGQPSLKSLVLEMLEKNKKGLKLDDIVERVLATGYKTGAANFKANVYQAMYNLKDEVDYDSEGKVYRLKSA